MHRGPLVLLPSVQLVVVALFVPQHLVQIVKCQLVYLIVGPSLVPSHLAMLASEVMATSFVFVPCFVGQLEFDLICLDKMEFLPFVNLHGHQLPYPLKVVLVRLFHLGTTRAQQRHFGCTLMRQTAARASVWNR